MALKVVNRVARSRQTQQSGAALVLVIVVAGVAVSAWQHRASLSQLFLAQQVLHQSTAAASLAAAQHQARLLNGHAFLNRTIMAHQVAMAHLMTIASAEKTRYEMSRRLARGNPPLFLIGMMFGPHHAAAYAASRVSVSGTSLSGVRELQQAFERHDHLLSNRLDKARERLLTNVQGDTRAIVRAVLDKNMTYQTGQRAQLMIDVDLPISELRPKLINPTQETWRAWFDRTLKQHQYLDKRRKTARNWWVINHECPHMRHELRRRGESDFSVDGLWQVTDSLSFHAVRGAKILLCYWREYPMGFSNIKNDIRGQQAMSESDRVFSRKGAAPEDFRKMTFLKWFTSQYAITSLFHGFANGLADGWGYRSRLRWRSRSVVKPYVLSGSDPFVIRVSVSQRLDSLKDPVLRLGLRIKGLLNIQNDWGQQLTSVAYAQTYYDRYEARRDLKHESANLFQPFWMARNVLAP